MLFIDRGVEYEFRLSARNAVDYGEVTTSTIRTPDGSESSERHVVFTSRDLAKMTAIIQPTQFTVLPAGDKRPEKLVFVVIRLFPFSAFSTPALFFRSAIYVGVFSHEPVAVSLSEHGFWKLCTHEALLAVNGEGGTINVGNEK